MKALGTILLLLCSNVLMTLAWYGHLKLQQMKVTDNWPLIGVILFSWGIAFFEYTFMVPANRMGFSENGGPFSVAHFLFQGQTFHWNHFVAFGLLVLAVFFAFLK